MIKDWDNLIGDSLLLYAKTCMFTKLPCFIEVSFCRFKHTTNSYLIHTDLKKLITSIFDSNKNKQFFPKCALAFHVVVFLTDFKTFRMLNIYLKCDYLFPMCVPQFFWLTYSCQKTIISRHRKFMRRALCQWLSTEFTGILKNLPLIEI